GKVCAGSMRERMDPAYRSEELEKFVPQFIPPGIKLSVVLLDKAPGADTHNRYIITELGGLNFSCGLEINESGSPDMVALMSENVWKQKFYEFDTLANHRIYDTLIFDKSGRGF
ncbi:MAG: hypothetical protein K2H64_00230, partial [Desulfovibrio sp.]|nr:hypothetical protein [Desulfovibrio sp.]